MTQAKAIICFPESFKHIQNIYKNCPTIKTIITIGTERLPELESVITVKFEDIIKTEGTVNHVDIDMNDIYLLNKSSGTTGLPKGVKCTHLSHGIAKNIAIE